MDEQRRQWWVLAGILLVFVGGSKGLNWWFEERAAATVKAHVKAGDITMYSTATCIYCGKARDWMSAHNVPWQECDVETNASCQQAYNAKGAPGTPLMLVKGQWHLGFDPEWLSQALR